MNPLSTFFEEFSQKWHNREAVAWKSPFPLPFRKEDIFTACAGYRKSVAEEEKYQLVELTLDDLVVGIAQPELLPSIDDIDFQGYASRLSRETGRKNFFAYFQNFEKSSAALWLTATDLLKNFCAKTGGYPHNSFLTVFLGNAEITPFGVHTDSHSIFTFVLEGQKHMRVWPDKGLPATLKDDVRRARPGLKQYAEHLDSSRLLVGNPGDVFYWPDTYWHVGEGHGTLTATVTLGVDLRVDPSVFFPGPLSSFLKKAELPPATGYHTSTTHEFPVEIEEVFAPFKGAIPEEIRRVVLTKWLHARSAYGFISAIPLREGEFEANLERIVFRNGTEIFSMTTKDSLSVFIHGHRIALPASEGFRQISELLRRAKPLKTKELEGLVSDSERPHLSRLMEFLFRTWAIEVTR